MRTGNEPGDWPMGDEDLEFIRSMTDDERRDVLAWLAGYAPEGFAVIKTQIIRWREEQAK